MRKIVLALVFAGLLAGATGANAVGQSPLVIDTVLRFNHSTLVSGGGVTASVGAINDVQSFGFQSISPQVGTPASMTIYVGGEPFMLVSFLTDYLGKPFAYRHLDGMHRIGTFASGNVFFH